VHGVRIQDIPPALRIRLCVSLADPNWKEEVKAGLEGRPPVFPTEPQTNYVWKVHQNFRGTPGMTAVEIRPRFGELYYWRFVVPVSSIISRWGHGPSEGGSLSGVQREVVDGGSLEIGGVDCSWFGAGDRLSPSTSAYVIFNGPIPSFVGFGNASDPFGAPQSIEILEINM
jgi:hypothetical protein